MGSSRKGIAGRKPLPDAVKELRGTLEDRRSRSATPGTPLTKIQQITSTRGIRVLTNKRAKEIFKQKCNQLMGLKILTELDLENLAIYAYNLDKIFNLMKDLEEEGDTITLFKVIYRKNGDVEQVPTKCIENPKWKLYRSLVDVNNKISGDYGFSPVGRMKFSLPKDLTPADPFEEIKQKMLGTK